MFSPNHSFDHPRSRSFGAWGAILCLLTVAQEAAAGELESGGATASSTVVLAQSESKSDFETVADHDGPEDRDSWEFSAGPYLWLAGLEGDLGVVAQVEPVGLDLSFGDILDSLKFAAMGTFDARRGRFVASGDLLYLKLGASDDVQIREVDFLEAEVESSTFITTLIAGYRAVDGDRLFLDLLAGARVNSMKTGLDLAGPSRSFSGTRKETWVDPVIGVRLQAPIGRSWSLRTYGDIGGFGVGSDLTWQLMGAIEYEVSSRWSLSAGWRHLDMDFEEDGFVFDAAMDGPILGAVYRF
jgi:hypothetical protein